MPAVVDATERAVAPGSVLAPRGLVVVCVLTNLAVATVAVLVGAGGGPALAVQAAAPPPLGLLADLRWLVVYSDDWWFVAFAVVGLLAGRSLLTATQAYMAWPAPRPPWHRLATRSVVFHAVMAVLLAPFVILLFAFGAFGVSWLYFASAPSVIVVAVLLHEAGLSSRWWRHVPGPVPLGWMGATIVAATVVAGVVSLAPRPLAGPGAALAGGFEAVAWTRIVRGVAGCPPARFVPFVPVVLAVFVGGAVIGAAVGFSVSQVHSTLASAGPAEGDTRGRVGVLVVDGFSSHWAGGAVHVPGAPPGALVREFSYRGLSAAGAPLPYAATATHASLTSVAGLMARQVAVLARITGRPVSIVAVSEGSAVADTYLASVRRPPVKVVILVSPLLDAGAVSYPPARSDGRGVAAGFGLRVLSSLLAPISTVDLSPDQPFLRSLLALRPSLGVDPPCGSCAPPREIEIVPLADTVAGAPVARPGVETVVTAGFHGGDFSDPAVRRALTAGLAGRPIPTSSTDDVLSRAIAGLASAWRVPSP